MLSSLDQLRDQLSAALAAAGLTAVLPADASRERLLAAAATAGLDEWSILRVLARVLDLPAEKSLARFGTSSDFMQKIPIAFARQHKLLGLSEDGEERLIVALGGISGFEQLPIVAQFLCRKVRPILTPQAVVLSAINDAYQQSAAPAQDFIGGLDRTQVLGEVEALAGRDDLLDNAARAPTIKLVNLILFEAVKAGASDVHIQPYDERLMVRMRIDGVLYDSYTLPKRIQEEVLSRVKVMGRMNIAEKRLPQDGRATVQVGDRNIDLRIASLPTSFGERIVIRLLDKSARLYALGELGMDEHTLRGFSSLINREHGLVLVTGPTGSGKSTTLYSALMQLNSKERNILTLEDPIEYHLDGISQSQVSEKKGMTFAKGLRSVLRQDPDVIMVGEIRDLETATMAIQSSLTGHLVFSTLHTNDAASAVTRLLDLGIEPYLVASSLIGVLAQRLVRRICPTCGVSYHAAPSELQWLNIDRAAAAKLRTTTGCAACRNTGFRGRLGCFELLALNDDIRRLVGARATAAEIKQVAVRADMRTLRDDGVEKILAGATTIAEVERVTLRSEELQQSAVPRIAATPAARM